MILLFITILTLFIIPFLPSAIISSYKSYSNIEDYLKVRVKIDSTVYRNDSGAKGSRKKYYLIYYNDEKLKLEYPYNKLLALKIDKIKYEYFKKAKQDSMYLWVNPKAKPIFAMEEEVKLDSSNFEKKLLINLVFFLVSIILYIRVVVLLIRPIKK